MHDRFRSCCRFEISEFQNDMEDMDQLLSREQSVQLDRRGSDPSEIQSGGLADDFDADPCFQS